MDIKKRLENEEFVGIAGNKKLRIKYLNENNIYTIEEFLNCDINLLYHSKESKTKVKIEKDILRYKYLQEPMARDTLLTSDITISDKEKCKYTMINALENLGFGNFSRVNRYFNEIAFNKVFNTASASIKIIDYLKCCLLDESDINYNLISFYVNYYDTIIYNRKITIKNDLQRMKDELVKLVLERKRLDKSIEKLTTEIEKEELILKR